MKGIELASLLLLSIAAILVFFLAAGFAVMRYTEQQPIYNANAPVPESSTVKRIQDATNLDGLRQTCIFWAERNDQFHEILTASVNNTMLITQAFVIAIGLLGAIFGGGSLYIYVVARRLSRSGANAL